MLPSLRPAETIQSQLSRQFPVHWQGNSQGAAFAALFAKRFRIHIDQGDINEVSIKPLPEAHSGVSFSW